MDGKTHITFLISSILGFMAWVLALPLTGQVEAWDSFGYFCTALCIAGLVSGLLSGFLGKHSSFFYASAIYVGLAIGVVVRMFTDSTGGPLDPSGFPVFLLIFALLFLIPSLLPVFISVSIGTWIASRLKPKI